MNSLPHDVLHEYFKDTKIHQCSQYYFEHTPHRFTARANWKCDLAHRVHFQAFLLLWLHATLNTFVTNKIGYVCETDIWKSTVFTIMFVLINYAFALLVLVFWLGLKCVNQPSDSEIVIA